MIALQVAPHFGELLGLGVQPLGEDLACGQHPFQHAPSERGLLDAAAALERPRRLEVRLRIEPRDVGGGHHPVRRQQQPFADLPLQDAARHADQPRRSRQRHPLHHRASTSRRGPSAGSRISSSRSRQCAVATRS
jgi:hypothetical protein